MNLTARASRKTVPFLALMGTLAAASLAQASVAVTDPGSRRVRNNGSGDYRGTLGYDLMVGSADVQVTDLGMWDGPGNQDTSDDGEVGDGLEQSAVVGIYRIEGRELVAQATVPAGDEGELEGEFRYVSLDQPVTLKAGETYRIVSGVDHGGNAFHDYRGGRENPSFTEHFMVGRTVYHHTHGAHDRLVFPNGRRAGGAYLGPNFRYEGGGAFEKPEATEEPTDRLKAAESLPGEVALADGFEDFTGGLPRGWTAPAGMGTPAAVVSPGAGYSGHALELTYDRVIQQAAPFEGLTYTLPEPADRVALAFDFKLLAGSSRHPSLEVFTLSPDSSEPTQLHLGFLGDRLRQYGGLLNGRVNVPIRSGDHPLINAPWYRIRLVIDRESEGIDIYLSRPDQPELSEQPIATVPANSVGKPISAIRFRVPVSSNSCWIDNLVIRTGSEIPAPDEPADQVQLSDGYQLWTGDTFPHSFADIDYPQGIEYSIVNSRGRDWHWYHGPSIEAHNGKLYASWGANPHGENQPGEVVLYNTSSDGGKTWSEAKILAPGDGKGGTEYSNSHGTLLSHNGKLWGFFQHWAGGWDNPLSTEAFLYDQDAHAWESKGIVATQGWPLDRPKRTANGDWVMGVSGFKMWRPAAMVSNGDNLLEWDTIAIPTGGEKRRFPETSLIVDGNDVWSITRWADRHRALVSTSSDGGRTWAEAQHSNLPMDTSKPDSGTLSTGQWYTVINIRDRDALMIAVGKPGEKGFSKLYKVRYGSPPTEHGYDGQAFPRRYCYPYSVEHNGKLYVTYSVALRDIEVAIIPIESLKAD